MKQITYPHPGLKVPVDKKQGRKLDRLAEKDIKSRPAVFLTALDFYYKHRMNSNQ